MAAKTKPKSKTVKKIAAKPAASRKSTATRGKTGRTAKPARAPAKPAKPTRAAAPSRKVVKKGAAKVVNRRASAAHKKPSKATAVAPAVRKKPAKAAAVAPRVVRSRPKAPDTLGVYEAGLKAMHAEDYDRAIRHFTRIVEEHHDEPEIQDRARVLVNASEKKQQESQRTVLKSADDHYNMGIAELNRRELESAAAHLQHALKLAPKGDHILYAMAAVHALQGKRDEALSFLKQSITHRPENRFLAVRDADFEVFVEDVDFKRLVTPPEK